MQCNFISKKTTQLFRQTNVSYNLALNQKKKIFFSIVWHYKRSSFKTKIEVKYIYFLKENAEIF